MSKENVSKLLTSRTLSFVANIDDKGEPDIRPMDFIFYDEKIHYMTMKNAHKVTQWIDNCPVAISVADDGMSIDELASAHNLRIYGKIKFTEHAKIPTIAEKYLEKYPHLKSLPGSPSDFIWYSVTFLRVVYKKGFEPEEVITY